MAALESATASGANESVEMSTVLSENHSGSSTGSTGNTRIESSTQTVTRMPKLPVAFFRVRLITSTAPPVRNCFFIANTGDWSDVWTHLQPTVRRVKRREWCISFALGVTVLLAMVLFLVIIGSAAWWGSHVYPDYRLAIGTIGTLLNYTVILAALWTFSICQGRTLLALQNEIQRAIASHEASTCFQERRGWHIDCQHDVNMGFALFMSNKYTDTDGTTGASMEQRARLRHNHNGTSNEKGPIHIHGNGSLRILLAAHFYGWSPVSLSHLHVSNDSRSSTGINFPSGFEALPQADWWIEFWCQCAPLALQYQRVRSMVTATYWCMALLSIPMLFFLPRFTPFLLMLWLSLFVPCESYVAGFALRLSRLLHQREAAQTCSTGYYVYLQDDVHEFSTSRYMGIMYTARYLVVAPMPPNDKTA